MSNKIKPVQSAEIAVANQSPSPMTFTQTGDNGTQIGRADVVNNCFNILLTGLPQSGAGQFDIIGALGRLNCDCYNLFVKAGESFDGSHFTIAKKRSLTEYTPVDTKNEYSSMSTEAIERIKTFPALFASENDTYRGKNNEGHVAYVGLITDIKIQEDDIKFYFCKLLSVSQDLINTLAVELNLGMPDRFNEMNCTHWTIKRINLIEELRDSGVQIPILQL